MYTLTHSIHPTIPLSTCSELSSNECTLTFHPLSHATLSITNLTAAHNSYRPNTQQAVPDTTHKVSVPATACHSLKMCACCIIFTQFIAPAATIKRTAFSINLIVTTALQLNINVSFNAIGIFQCFCLTLATWQFHLAKSPAFLSPTAIKQHFFLHSFPSM